MTRFEGDRVVAERAGTTAASATANRDRSHRRCPFDPCLKIASHGVTSRGAAAPVVLTASRNGFASRTATLGR